LKMCSVGCGWCLVFGERSEVSGCALEHGDKARVFDMEDE